MEQQCSTEERSPVNYVHVVEARTMGSQFELFSWN